jgi:hypothetical protein
MGAQLGAPCGGDNEGGGRVRVVMEGPQCQQGADVAEAAAVGRHDRGGPGSQYVGGKRAQWPRRMPSWDGGHGSAQRIVFFSIYSKTFQTESNRFDPKMVSPYSKNSK